MERAPDDKSGTGVILGIFIAILLMIGGYFFIQNQDGLEDNKPDMAVNIEAPDGTKTEPAAGEGLPPPAPAPAE